MTDIHELLAGRRGHFALESGHHGALWLDLDALFADSRRIAPFVSALARAVEPHHVNMVCGPLLGGAFLAQLIAHELRVDFSFTERRLPEGPDGLYRARYHLPRAFSPRVRGARVAMVDDVMSAGSALRATHAELTAHGANPVVVGALLVLGDAGESHFAQLRIPVEAGAREAYTLWAPGDCPLCRDGLPLERPYLELGNAFVRPSGSAQTGPTGKGGNRNP